MRFPRLRAAAAALAVGGLLVAGCGSSSSSSSTAAASASPSTTTAAAATSTGAGSSRYSYGSPTTTAAAAPANLVITTKHAKLGTILAAGPKRMTVYLFEADKGSQSACAGECAKAWPPVLGSASAGGAAMSADLGTTKRSDGTTQVTYKGHPLYYFIKDKDDGDAYGQGVKAFGASWYVLKPSGAKLDES